MFKKIILICGMPRSGTSWLGQIFDSSPDVAFRMEPLFAYRFKNIINDRSSDAEIIKFFHDVYLTTDDFIHQNANRAKGIYDSFNKNPTQEFLAIKTTRHHHLIKRYLNSMDNIDVISIIRHPCAVISSWLATDREFSDKGCQVEKDWRNGACRKNGDGEFWGFDDWLSITRHHLDLCQKYENFTIVKYAELVKNPERVAKGLFGNLGLAYAQQTSDFLETCHSRSDDDPYSVFKGVAVENQWKNKLDRDIAQEIIKDTVAAGLHEFLE